MAYRERSFVDFQELGAYLFLAQTAVTEATKKVISMYGLDSSEVTELSAVTRALDEVCEDFDNRWPNDLTDTVPPQQETEPIKFSSDDMPKAIRDLVLKLMVLPGLLADENKE